MKTFFKILLTLIALPLGVMGAVLIFPLLAFRLVLELPALIICDIWER